jgi:hypothetical protein
MAVDSQMKIPIFCLTCSINGQDVHASAQVMDVRDDDRYEAVCPNGHSMTILLQELKFEILFEIGAYAIYDGYHREAVSSFTSSLERFYEFVIRIILDSSGLTDAVISAIWRPISKQSERQLGAFITLYGNAFQKAPPLLSDKEVKFRNDVIHQGMIPSRNDAIQYGQALLNLIRPTLREIRIKYPKSINKLLSDHLTACRGESKDPVVSTMGLGTIISLTNLTPGHDEQSLEEAVEKLTNWKKELGLRQQSFPLCFQCSPSSAGTA